jgi:large subunit ribosomal protein L5
MKMAATKQTTEKQAQARLLKEYKEKVIPALVKEFGYKNAMQVPKLVKINLNMGVGEALKDSKAVDVAANELTLIAGQKALVTKARKSIAHFRLRQGQGIGAKVTLRNRKMYEFMDRLVNIALPKLRDFRGLNIKSFDGNGNISFGLKEHTIFPELQSDRTDSQKGMDITIVTTARTAQEAQALLAGFNVPFLPTETNNQQQ